MKCRKMAIGISTVIGILFWIYCQYNWKPNRVDIASRVWARGRHPHVAYLPSGRTVAVSFILEIRHKAHHPVVDLGQRQSLLGGALYGTRDEVRVRQVPPRVTPGRLGFAQLAGHIQRGDGGGHARRCCRRRSHHGRLDVRRRAAFPLSATRGHVVALLRLHFDRGQTSARLVDQPRPGARLGASVEFRINLMRAHAAALHHHEHGEGKARSLSQNA